MANKYKTFSQEAQKKRKQEWACGRKKPFSSLEEAAVEGHTAYQCEYCSMWHRSSSLMKLASKAKHFQSDEQNRRNKTRRERK